MARFFRKKFKSVPKIRVFKNEEIRANEVRVIDEDGEQIGVLKLRDAIARAREKNLDLILASAKTEPKICKIGDWGSFIFNKQKAAKKQRAASKKNELKEIRLSMRISDHDLKVKIEKAKDFLQKNHKIKAVLQLRGRENTHAEIGFAKLKTFEENLADIACAEERPRRMGTRIILNLKPEKAKK